MKNVLKKIFIILTTYLVLFTTGWTVHAEVLPTGATITVLNDDETVVQTTAVSLEGEKSAFDLLEEVADVQYEETDYGPFITGINDHMPNGEDYWGFFINGVEASVGAADYEVNHGDNILFKVTSFPPETVTAAISIIDLAGEEILPQTEIEITSGATAYDALVQATVENNLTLDVSVDSEWLTFLNDINDLQDDSSYWGLYLNGAFMQTGLVQYQMQDGDQLLIQAETLEATEDQEESNQEESEVPSITINKEIIEDVIRDTSTYINGINGLDWYGIIAYHALGIELPGELLTKTMAAIKEAEGNYEKVTDLEKHILITTAFGKNAKEIEGIDLIDALTNHEGMMDQGNNGPILALLALDSANYEVRENAEWTRERLIDTILNAQNQEGYWALMGEAASVDLTGLALAALSPYKEQDKVQKATNLAVTWIAENQIETGGFYDELNGGEASESIALAIIGLTAVGEDPTGESFTKNANLIERLLAFQKDGNGFSHLVEDDEANPISSNQALLALAAFSKNENVFAMSSEFALESDSESHPLADPTIWIVIVFAFLVGAFVAVTLRKRKKKN